MNLTEHMNAAIEGIVGDALRGSLKNPRETAFLLRAAASQKKAAERRRAAEAEGRHIPPFLIASIAARCNLHCAGCYARANRSCSDSAAEELPADRWDRIFGEAEELGVSFLLLAGGEPLTRRDVLEKAAGHPELIFPVFTNGTMLGGLLGLFDAHRNLVPVLSIEGGPEETDRRRGAGTYRLLERAMEDLNRRGILYGASVTVTRENLKEVSGSGFVGNLEQTGCRLVFFVEYVPVDPESGDLAPGDVERALLEKRLEALRSESRMLFLSFPGDEKALGGCLAAGRGFFHINARGGAEPCPFSPYSDYSLRDGTLSQALDSALFRRLREEGLTGEGHAGGCALFARQNEVRALLAESLTDRG